jgi:hypothetical protein
LAPGRGEREGYPRDQRGAGQAGRDAEGADPAALAPATAPKQRAAGPATELGDGDRDTGPARSPEITLPSSPCHQLPVRPGIPETTGAECTWAVEETGPWTGEEAY